jgi:hypothetical protein
MELDTKIYLLTDHQSQCDFDFDLTVFSASEFPSRVEAESNTSTVTLQVVGGYEYIVMFLKGVEKKSVQNSIYELDVMKNSHSNESAYCIM